MLREGTRSLRRNARDGDRLIRTAGVQANMQLRALSADAALLPLLRASPPPARVHSVFARVVNVQLAGERLLTLAHRAADDAPDSAVVDLDSWSSFDFAPGTDVRLADGRIDIGSRLSIELADARPWQPWLPAYAQDTARLRANVPAAQDYLDHHGKGIGLRRAAGSDPTALELATVMAFRGSAEGLCDALAHDDETLAREHVDALVGLGPGLTPSGDDFLLGLLAALNIAGSPKHAWRRIGGRVVERARKQTQLISAVALRHAAKGRVRASVIDLCDALMHAPAIAMLRALDRVMRIGASSGSEIALGVLVGFRLHLNRNQESQRFCARSERSGVVHAW